MVLMYVSNIVWWEIFVGEKFHGIARQTFGRKFVGFNFRVFTCFAFYASSDQLHWVCYDIIISPFIQNFVVLFSWQPTYPQKM